MSRSLTDIFNDYPGVEVIEVVGHDNDGQFGLSSDGRKLKILDDIFARQLAKLPHSNTETGHITDEGYCIRGRCVKTDDCCKAWVYRHSPTA